MKATLLIKNIENLYTCDASFRILQNAYIALYHDKIIALGTGSYAECIEPSTRVIDAVGECVIPGLIDCRYIGFERVRLGDPLRENSKAFYAMRQNGLLTLVTPNPKLQRMELTQDVIYRKQAISTPILSRFSDFEEKGKPEEFILSCGFGNVQRYIYSLQPICYSLFNDHLVDSKRLLQGMTSLPASLFDLKDRGSLEEGKLGDIIVLQVPTIEHYFHSLGRPLIHRMIKNGIPFYPQWMVC